MVRARIPRTLLTLCATACASVLWQSFCKAQTSHIIPWSDGRYTEFSISTNAYHPEPIVFVHGITASRLVWQDVIAHLHTQQWFSAYHYRSNEFNQVKESTFDINQQGYNDANVPVPDATNQWRDIEQPYLHTFNYGRHAYRAPMTNVPPVGAFWDAGGIPTVSNEVRISRQSHDPVEWNSWQAPVNDYLHVSAGQQHRTTLQQRVDAIRQAYRMPGQEPPNVILIGHSLGGLVICDYLQRKNEAPAPDPYVPVRRVTTINTLLWGSPLANVLLNWGNIEQSTHGNMALLQFLMRTLAPSVSSSHAGMGVWIENHRGATRYLAMDLQDAIRKGNVPPLGSDPGELLFDDSPFQTRLHTLPMPTTTEFISSGSLRDKEPVVPYIGLPVRVLMGRRTLYNDIKTAMDGDGAVPLGSMAGYNADGTPVFTNIFPVDIRGYLYTNVTAYGTNWICNHGQAPQRMNVYPLLLDGVSYLTGPRPERPGGWSGLQKQYTNAPTETVGDVTFTHADEPGIANLILLYPRAQQNPLLIPTTNTWIVSTGAWQKVSLTTSNFSGSQVIAGSNGDPLQCVGTVGVKNRSENPVGMDGTNYWVVAGNEYLPASLKLQAAVSNAPLPMLTNLTAAVTGAVNQCLVQLDGNGAPQFQYGVFTNAGAVSVAVGTNNYVAVQGQNLGGLLTPQAERAFDAPVNSVSLVNVLRKINEGEALSNGCHGAATPSHWTMAVTEWINVPSNGVFTLNFIPTTDLEYGGAQVLDAWTGTEVGDWLYNINDNTFTLADPQQAPSHLLIGYEAYVGCKNVFTNDLDAVVPALTDSTLAGLRVTEDWLTTVRGSLSGILNRYRDTSTNACVGWTLPRVLVATGNSTGDWLPVTNGLLRTEHFVELSNVVAQLTTGLNCVEMTGFLTAGTVGEAYSGRILASNGVSPYAYAVTNGNLPPGLTLGEDGYVEGTPTVSSNATFTVVATDSNGCKGTKAFQIQVDCPTITFNELPNGVLNQPYSQSVSVQGGHGPYTFALIAGQLPEGLSMNNAGAISGTPNASPGSSIFTLRVTDTYGCTATTPEDYSIYIECPP